MEESPAKEANEVNEAGGENDEMDELINTLEEQRKDHENNGRFLEADTVYQRILKLKQDQKRKKEERLKQKQEKEANDIESEYNEELKNFNNDWDDRIEKYKAQCKESEEQMKQRQANETETTTKQLEESIPIIPKHSSEYLNLKRIQDTLVRNKEYKEAHVIQQTMVDLEEKEKLTWGDERISKIQQNLAALAKRQENEMNRLIMKAKNGFEELRKQRAAELESLIKKYQNIQKEMKIAHKLETNRLSGLHTTGSGVFKSDINASARAIFTPKAKKTESDGVNNNPEAAEVEAS
ncbi:hypothetical protein SteCoe_22635 [Stentor coeruleus]|uniref:Uncharacterized protein n=1 Tax=Stentor coeruleus TaxID=5963 RepID=A0A1R2BLI5_9CILI|nr:hypothetical protein SteCoe_22635 [Stentor coeruleus]